MRDFAGFGKTALDNEMLEISEICGQNVRHRTSLDVNAEDTPSAMSTGALLFRMQHLVISHLYPQAIRRVLRTAVNMRRNVTLFPRAIG
jgi:hypothetical protein